MWVHGISCYMHKILTRGALSDFIPVKLEMVFLFIIYQVVLCKFHTVFLSHRGAVFTCGHGRGGRLGHKNEQSIIVSLYVL